MKERLHLIIEGLVQGVLFREAVKKKADAMQITGWIKNNQDGSLEAVFEGEEARLRKMLAFCREGPPDAVVDTIEEEWDEYAEEFDSFEIELD